MQTQRVATVSVATTQAVQQGLTGDLKLVEGYNCLVRTQEDNNAINLHAFLGAGEGPPCDFWNPQDQEEDCDELIFTLNGLKPDNYELQVAGKSPISVIPTIIDEVEYVYIRLGDGRSKLVCQQEEPEDP
jgi:hypothetical protein